MLKKISTMLFVSLLLLTSCDSARFTAAPYTPLFENIPQRIIKTKVVVVSSVVELIEAIASDTCIVLTAGVYDVSTISELDNGYHGRSDRTLNIYGVSNLMLLAAPGAAVEIVTPDRFSQVVYIDGCDGIVLRNIKFGHSVTDEYECDAGVIQVKNSEDITIDGCYIYGSGSIGIWMTDCYDVSVENTTITDCSLYGVDLWKCRDISFTNCKLTDHRAYMNVIHGYETSAIFTDCEISGNKRVQCGVVDIDGDILFERCEFRDNAPGVDEEYMNLINGRGISIRDCVIEKGAFSDYWTGVIDLGGNEFIAPDYETDSDLFLIEQLKNGNFTVLSERTEDTLEYLEYVYGNKNLTFEWTLHILNDNGLQGLVLHEKESPNNLPLRIYAVFAIKNNEARLVMTTPLVEMKTLYFICKNGNIISTYSSQGLGSFDSFYLYEFYDDWSYEMVERLTAIIIEEWDITELKQQEVVYDDYIKEHFYWAEAGRYYFTDNGSGEVTVDEVEFLELFEKMTGYSFYGDNPEKPYLDSWGVDKTQHTEAWKDAYADFLRNPSNIYMNTYLEMPDSFSYTFAIRDLTNDGIPELLVYYIGESMGAGSGFLVYTLNEDTVEFLGYISTGRSRGQLLISDDPDFPGIFSHYVAFYIQYVYYSEFVNGQIVETQVREANGQDVIDTPKDTIDWPEVMRGDESLYDAWRQSYFFPTYDITEDNIREVILADFEKTWQEAYTTFLRETNFVEEEPSYFALRDLDSDGIPELLLIQMDENALNAKLNVYTYNGCVYKIGEYSNPKKSFAGGFRLSDNPMFPGLFECWWGGGVDYYGYLSVVNGELVYEYLWLDNHASEQPYQEIFSDNTQLVNESINANPPYDYTDNVLKLYPSNNYNIVLDWQSTEQVNTWQEAYTELLLNFETKGDDLFFLLYDFDKDGTPELIIAGGGESWQDILGLVYSFRNGEIIAIECGEGVEIAVCVLSATSRLIFPPDNAPGLIAYSGGPGSLFGASLKLKFISLEEDRLVVNAYGWMFIDTEELYKLLGYDGVGFASDRDAYNSVVQEHTYYYIDDNLVTEEDFNNVFVMNRPDLEFNPDAVRITDDNIRDVLSSWTEHVETDSFETYMNVLQSKDTFCEYSHFFNGTFSKYYYDGEFLLVSDNKYDVEYKYLNEYINEFHVDIDTFRLYQFTILDMDGDGIPEIVLEFNPVGHTLLLHYENGIVYGYSFSYRGMYSITKAGTFISSGGAGNWGIYKLAFEAGICEEVELCRVDDPVYRVNGEDVSWELFTAFAEENDKIGETIWYLYNEDSFVTDFSTAWKNIN